MRSRDALEILRRRPRNGFHEARQVSVMFSCSGFAGNYQSNCCCLRRRSDVESVSLCDAFHPTVTTTVANKSPNCHITVHLGTVTKTKRPEMSVACNTPIVAGLFDLTFTFPLTFGLVRLGFSFPKVNVVCVFILSVFFLFLCTFL